MTMTDLDDTKPVDTRDSLSISKQGNIEHQRRVVEDVGAEKRHINYRVTRFVYLVFAVLESILSLRLLLRLIGANPINPFANALYRFTNLFVGPFNTLVVNPSSRGLTLEVTTIIAMLVYLLLGWALIQLVWLIFYRAKTRTVTTIDRQK